MRRRAQSAAKVNLEPTPRLAILDSSPSPQANVVNLHRRVVLRTTLEGDLKLASEILVVLVTHQIAKQRLTVRRDVKGFGVRGSGEIAASNVSHRVAASLARGDASLGKKAQERRSLFEVHVV